jgi:hypothetical protein
VIRELAGFVGIHLVLVTAGLGLLRGLGLVAPGPLAVVVAFGPALLAGVCVVVVALIALLVVGVPLGLPAALVVGVVCAAAGFVVGRRRVADDSAVSPVSLRALSRSLAVRAGIAAAGVYAAFGAFALARAPTRGDDARIWSLKGLTLTYYDSLRPEIFHNPLTGEAHQIYPLFQPVLEAVLNRAMGRPELRLFHAELWLLLGAAIWTGAYLIWWRSSRPAREQVGLAALAMLAFTPAVVSGTWTGFADVTGSVLLATGALALGLWIDRGDGGHLGLAAVFLAAAANAKDEDMVGAALVLLVAGVAVAVRGERRRLLGWTLCAAICAALVLPWRIWVAAHHLSDNVTPPLPHALSPVYVLDRLSELHRAAAAMVDQTLAGWGWLAAIFLAVCAVCIATRTARRLAWFYLSSFAALVAALLWLYTTTPVSLDFLIPTSMYRTVDVFMALTPFAVAHLLARLGPGLAGGGGATGSRPPSAPRG